MGNKLSFYEVLEDVFLSKCPKKHLNNYNQITLVIVQEPVY